MKKKLLIWTSLAAMMLVGCNVNTVLPEGDDEIHFKVGFPQTKVMGTSFEKNDEMGVYITEYQGETPSLLQLGGNYITNAPVVYDGLNWNADPKIYWGSGKYDIYAYYPMMDPVSIEEQPFQVALDQNIPESETSLSTFEQSDFLWTSKLGIKKMDIVPLVFQHCMSKLTIQLKKGKDYTGDIPADAVVQIHNTVTDAFVDLTSGVVTKNPYSPARSIKARQLEIGKYDAIILPQHIKNRVALVEVICKDVSYMVETRFIFKAGVNHTITITLDNNPEKVKIEIGGEIENGWQE